MTDRDRIAHAIEARLRAVVDAGNSRINVRLGDPGHDGFRGRVAGLNEALEIVRSLPDPGPDPSRETARAAVAIAARQIARAIEEVIPAAEAVADRLAADPEIDPDDDGGQVLVRGVVRGLRTAARVARDFDPQPPGDQS